MNWTISQTVDLAQGYTPVVWPNALMVSGDVGAHTWRVTVLDGGAAADISGATITGSFLRADGNTVLVSGSISGNIASVTLTDVCYAVEGKMKGTIKMTKSGTVITLAAVIFMVSLFTSGSVIDPGVAYADFQIDASPKGAYANLAALNADPSADVSKIYLTLDDGKWCYHNGSAWVAGGVYQAVLPAQMVIGKNLARLTPGIFVQDNGVTVTVSVDGVVTIDGAASANKWVDLSGLYAFLETGKTYTLSMWGFAAGIVVTNNASVVLIDGAETTTIAAAGDTQKIRLYLRAGTVYNNDELWMQIEEGSVATAWERNGYVISGSPYPDMIRNAVDASASALQTDEIDPIKAKTDIIYKSVNLFNPTPGVFDAGNGQTVTVDESGVITINGKSTSSVWFELTPYSAILPSVGTYTITRFDTVYFDIILSAQIGGVNTTIASGFGTHTISDIGTSQRLLLRLASGLSFENLRFRIQIESGASATDWERYGYLIKAEAYEDDIEKRITDLLDATAVEALLPDKVWMIEQEKLRIYKSSIAYLDSNRALYDIAAYSDGSADLPYFAQAREMIEVDPDYVGSTLGVYFSDNYITPPLGKTIALTGRVMDVEICDANTVSNTTPTVCIFGDSVTYNGLATRVKESLLPYTTPTFIGTVNDSLGTPCEARSGLALSNYTGYRTISSSGAQLSNYPNFLKLATASDKSNTPDYCFTRTGVGKEDTYTEAVDKNQDFYIFDFANYLATNGYAAPDVVVINMGTNDIGGYFDTEADHGVSIILSSIDIMITQIQAAAPNAKILVIPAPVRGRNGKTTPAFVDWIKQSLGLQGTNVDVLFEFVHQSMELSFVMTETAIPGRIDKSYFAADITHTGSGGYKEGAKPIAYYILNQL